MTEGLRKTISHASVYGIGTVIANATSIVMLPIYTRFLTPHDYGLLEYLQMITDVTSILFGARAFAGFYRMYFETESEADRKSITNTALITDFGLHALGALFLFACSQPIAVLVFGDFRYASYINIFACSLFTMGLTTVPMYYLRALGRPWSFISVSTLKLLGQVSLNIAFVAILKMGAVGVIYSTVLVGAVIGTGLTAWTLRRTGLRFSLPTCIRLLRFGLPIALASVGAFYTTYGDRFFLKHFWGLAEVGLYALSYRFGFALYYLVYSTFDQVWSAQAYAVQKQEDYERTFARVFLLIMIALIVSGTALSVLSGDIIRIMASPQFLGAAAPIPILIAAYVVRAAGDFCGFGIRLSERTVHFLHASLISVAVMTVGYVALIPPFGSMGAAIATLLGMIAEFWWIVRKANMYLPLKRPWAKIVAATCLGILTWCVCQWLAPSGLAQSIVFRAAVLVIFAVSVFFSRIVGPGERLACYRLSRDLGHRLRLVRPAS